MVDGKLYGVPFTWGGGPMVYDPAVVTTVPTSWKDLLKPEFTGKVGMMDDPLGNMMIGALVATGTKTPTKLSPEQLEATIDFLIEMKKQSRVVAASWGDLSDAIARGDVAITFNGWETMVKFCRRQGQGGDGLHLPRRSAPMPGSTITASPRTRPTSTQPTSCATSCDQRRAAEAPRRERRFRRSSVRKPSPRCRPTIKALYPYDEIEDYGQKASFFGFPPVEPEDGS